MSANIGEDVGELDLSHTIGESGKWYNDFGKLYQFLKKLNISCPSRFVLAGLAQCIEHQLVN